MQYLSNAPFTVGPPRRFSANTDFEVHVSNGRCVIYSEVAPRLLSDTCRCTRTRLEEGGYRLILCPDHAEECDRRGIDETLFK
jgi:hypothetical protein